MFSIDQQVDQDDENIWYLGQRHTGSPVDNNNHLGLELQSVWLLLINNRTIPDTQYLYL